jgi:glycerol uptake facilitator-like aquaporin
LQNINNRASPNKIKTREREKKNHVDGNQSTQAQPGEADKPVEGQSRYELYNDEGSVSFFTLWIYRFFSAWGMYRPPYVSQVIWAAFREVLGCTIISATVGLVAFFAVGLNVLLGGVLVAGAYYVAYTFATMLPIDETLRGHYNGAITMGYLVMSRIGVIGAIGYMVAQLVGSIFGGLLLAYSLVKYVPSFTPVVQSTVPLPTTLITNFGTIFVLEMVGAAIITLVLLIGEFVGTSSDAEKVGKNYKRGTTRAAFATAVFVVIGFPFQVFTYSNVAYFGGLFGNVLNLDAGRNMADLAQLNNIITHTNSTFGTAAGQAGGAWAHYFFTPMLGGVVGAMFAAAVYYARYNVRYDLEETGDVCNEQKRATRQGQPMEKITAAAATQTPVQMQSTFHKTK